MTIEPIELYDRSASFSVRWIVGIHLASVVFSKSLSLADYGQLISPAFSDWYELFFLGSSLTGLLILGIMFGCPLLMFLNLFKSSLSLHQKIIGAIAEFLLTIVNLFVLLPLVQ